MTDLRTRAEVAASLGMSDLALRRRLRTLPGIGWIRAGRRVLFTPAAEARLLKALECHSPCANVAPSGTRLVRTVSARKTMSAQDAVRELLRRPSRPNVKPSGGPHR